MMEPCEDILSTSSFCHGVAGNAQDGYCRCDETLEANGFVCAEPAWVDGVGLFLPELYCKRTCGKCLSDMRPLWVPGCNNGDHSGMDHGGTDHSDIDQGGMDHSDMDHSDMDMGMDMTVNGSGSGSRTSMAKFFLPKIIVACAFVFFVSTS